MTGHYFRKILFVYCYSHCGSLWLFYVLLCVACVRSGIAIILMGKRELIALLSLSSWCLVMVGRLFPTVPRGCLQFVIVVFPDNTHLLFLNQHISSAFALIAHVSLDSYISDLFVL